MLRIHLLGHLHVEADGAPLPFAALPKVLPLWAYLLLHRDRAVPRLRLAGQLWDDVPDHEALANLRRHLHGLHQFLPPSPPDRPWILTAAGRLQWNPAADAWLDVAEFETLSLRPDRLAEAVVLYAGDLLPEVDAVWCLADRERLRQLFFADLTQLVRAEVARGAPLEAVGFVQQALRFEPTHEAMGRRLMVLHTLAGDRSAGLAAYATFSDQLRSELGVEPMAETKAIYAAILENRQLPDALVSDVLGAPLGIGASETSQDAATRQQASPAPTVSSTLTASPTPSPAPATAPVPAPLVTAPPTNLPAQLTSFVGRGRELAEVCALLAGPREAAVRLVTLTGPGGTGKTRLSQAVGRWLLEHRPEAFPDGVFVVDLSALTDPGLVAQTIAETLAIRGTGERTVVEDLIGHLSGLRILLILDNFEQITAAAPIVADLLAAAPSLSALVASRAALHLYGEHEQLVPPLELPDLHALPPLDAMADFSAVALFVARARAANPGFALTAANAPAVAELCVRFDGLPLAIELLAAHAKLFGPEVLLTRLGDRATGLASRAANRPTRHQSLHNVVEWSYRLLSSSEQEHFARLAVFAGPFSLSAAETVLAADGSGPVFPLELNAPGSAPAAAPPGESVTHDRQAADDVWEHLAALVDKSMLVCLPATEYATEPRFRMLATLREFALDRLVLAGEEPAVRDRHAAYYLELVEAATHELRGPNEIAWLRVLDESQDNFRAAIAWCHNRPGGIEAELRLTAGLQYYWDQRCAFEEGRQHLERALTRAEGSPASAVHSNAANGAAALALRSGDWSNALRHGETSLDMARAIGDEGGVIRALNILAGLQMRTGNFAKAETMLEEALASSRRLGNPTRITVLLGNLGILALEQRHYETAETLLAEGLEMAREQGNSAQVLLTLSHLGILALEAGDATTARRLAAESLEVARAVGDPWSTAFSELNLGLAAAEEGDHALARQSLDSSFHAYITMGDTGTIAILFSSLARQAIRDGRPAQAVRLCAAARRLWTEIDAPITPRDEGQFEENLAAAKAMLDDAAFAEAWVTGLALSAEAVMGEALAGMSDDQ